VQTVEHGDDALGDAVEGFGGFEVLFLPHVWVHHEVWGVGFDHGGGGRLADYV
jgi:hypothetical protein